jgi:hypothetical protein
MSKITKQLAICAALRARGFKARPDKDTRKYVVFESPLGKFYWLGKQGAVRVGPSVSKTFSIGDSRANHLARIGGYDAKQPLNPRCDMGGSNTEHLPKWPEEMTEENLSGISDEEEE